MSHLLTPTLMHAARVQQITSVTVFFCRLWDLVNNRGSHIYSHTRGMYQHIQRHFGPYNPSIPQHPAGDQVPVYAPAQTLVLDVWTRLLTNTTTTMTTRDNNELDDLSCFH